MAAIGHVIWQRFLTSSWNQAVIVITTREGRVHSDAEIFSFSLPIILTLVLRNFLWRSSFGKLISPAQHCILELGSEQHHVRVNIVKHYGKFSILIVWKANNWKRSCVIVLILTTATKGIGSREWLREWLQRIPFIFKNGSLSGEMLAILEETIHQLVSSSLPSLRLASWMCPSREDYERLVCSSLLFESLCLLHTLFLYYGALCWFASTVLSRSLLSSTWGLSPSCFSYRTFFILRQ